MTGFVGQDGCWRSLHRCGARRWRCPIGFLRCRHPGRPACANGCHRHPSPKMTGEPVSRLGVCRASPNLRTHNSKRYGTLYVRQRGVTSRRHAINRRPATVRQTRAHLFLIDGSGGPPQVRRLRQTNGALSAPMRVGSHLKYSYRHRSPSASHTQRPLCR